MEASRRRRSIWWWFWTYFVVNTFHTTLFSHVIIVTYICYKTSISMQQHSRHRSTLIDQSFCKIKNHRDIKFSGIVKTNISDHFPYFALLDICKTYQHKPKFITTTSHSEGAYQSFCNEVKNNLGNWTIKRDLLNDRNENYNAFEKIILDAKDKFLPPKKVRFKKYRHKLSPWITNGILTSIKQRDKIHLSLIASRGNKEYNVILDTLHSYKSMLKKIIRLSKRKYYAEQLKKNQT